MDIKSHTRGPKHNTSAMNLSCASTSTSHERSTSRTPKRGMSISQKLSSSKTGITPGKKGLRSKTPDRYVSDRQHMDMDMANYKLRSAAEEDILSPGERQRKNESLKMMTGKSMDDTVLALAAKPKPTGKHGDMKVLYTLAPGSTVKPTRYIANRPEQVLDAPEIMDDYYLNVIDWSSNNHLAAALRNSVYLWNAASGEISELFTLEDEDDYVCAVSWVKQGNFLAVSLSNGDVQLYDVSVSRRLRVMRGHTARASSLAWNEHLLSSGSQDCQIHHHDVRVANHHVGTLRGHNAEVCTLKWSETLRQLASGSNDNNVHIWDKRATEPVHTLGHTSATKAVAWCPFDTHILATGGGLADRTIRLWSAHSGDMLSSTDAHSQVCSLVWSDDYKELLSSHGFCNYCLNVWSYPNMKQIAELKSHESRVLYLAKSPDGEKVASAAADESIRLWTVWPRNEAARKKAAQAQRDAAVTGMMRAATLR